MISGVIPEQCGQVQYFCIESNFTEGVPRGTTRGQRWDGGWAVEYFHLVGEGVPHGLHVEVSGPAQDYIVVEMMLNGSPSADKGSWLRRHSVISFAKPSSSPETLWMHADLAKCEPVVFDTSLSVIRRVGNVSAWIEDGYCQVKWTTGQGELDDSIQIPQHLGKLTPREKQEVLAHLYATQCEKNFRTPYQNLVIDKELAMKESRDIAPHETFYVSTCFLCAGLFSPGLQFSLLVSPETCEYFKDHWRCQRTFSIKLKLRITRLWPKSHFCRNVFKKLAI